MMVLISSSVKEGIDEIAVELAKMGYEILATEGTAEYLEASGIKVRKTSEITGLVERRELKTLHHRLYEMIFSGQIEAVIVVPYPFEHDPSFENIDIGGISLIRATAKSGIPVAFDFRSAKDVIEALKTGSKEVRKKLIREAFMFTSRYDGKVAEWLSNEAP